jgi:DNA polymerase elongation subunit (family B)
MKWKKGADRVDYDWKGMGAIRTDTSPLLRDLQEVLGKSLVDGEDLEYRSDYLRKLEKRLINNEIPLWDYAAPRQLKKLPEEYEVQQPHVKGSLYANKWFSERFKKNDKPRWVYVVPPPEGFEFTDVIAFTGNTEIPNGFQADVKKIVKKLIQPQIDRFLNIMGEDFQIETENLVTAPKLPRKKPTRKLSTGQTTLF